MVKWCCDRVVVKIQSIVRGAGWSGKKVGDEVMEWG